MEKTKRKELKIETISLPKVRQMSTHFSKRHNDKSYTVSGKENSLYREANSKTLFYSKFLKHRKTTSRIQENLELERSHLIDLKNVNKELLNKTFFRMDSKSRVLKESSKLQKKKVFNMEKQDLTNKFKLSSQEEIYTGPMIVLEYKIEMSFLNNFCYDSNFSLKRVGATMVWADDELFMFGGCPDSISTPLSFHQYSQACSQWKRVRSIGEKPILSLLYHTVDRHRQFLIFCGGFSIEKNTVKKCNNTQISLFNFENRTWQHYSWRFVVRNHSSCCIHDLLLVFGGINERERTGNSLHFIEINFSRPSHSRTIEFQTNLCLSHHKMVHTYSEQNRFRSKFAVDGLLVFGGKDSNEQLSNDLYFISPKFHRVMERDTSDTFEFETLKIEGAKPPARMCHSFDLLPGKGLCLLVGGIGEDNEYLDDLWILDLFGLNWIQVEEVPLLKQTGGIAYHCTAIKESEVYVYGGISRHPTSKQFYLIETQKYKKSQQKHSSQSKRQVNLSTSNLISFKAFQ